MRKSNRCSIAAWVAALLVGMAGSHQAVAADGRFLEDLSESDSKAVPAAAGALARHVLATADNAGLPFAIVDKQLAIVWVYRHDGTLVAKSTVLLGATPGDHATEGVGHRTQTGQLRPQDHTTPSGRFFSAPGRNLTGEAIVWIDYANGLAIHRLRPAPLSQRRVERMASADPTVKRISAGCVVVPEDFYDQVIQPVLGHGRGIVYVLPEAGGTWQPLRRTAARTQ